MKTIPHLEDVLRYKNEDVIMRFKMNHPKDAHRASILFTEMLRYLWLCEKFTHDKAKEPNNPELAFIPVMHEEMRAIDNMWHEFILLTREYQQFCDKYFGHFLHHEPNMRQQLNYSEEDFVHSLNLFLSYIYDTLGEQVVRLWFEDNLKAVA